MSDRVGPPLLKPKFIDLAHVAIDQGCGSVDPVCSRPERLPGERHGMITHEQLKAVISYDPELSTARRPCSTVSPLLGHRVLSGGRDVYPGVRHVATMAHRVPHVMIPYHPLVPDEGER